MNNIGEDLTDEEKKLGWKVAMTAGHRALMWFFIAFSFGAFAVFGVPGFAKEVDFNERIEEVIAPVKVEQSQMRGQLEVISKTLRETLAQNKATEIRLLAARRCLEARRGDGQALDISNREIDAKQVEYRDLKSYEYQIPRCEHLVASPPK